MRLLATAIVLCAACAYADVILPEQEVCLNAKAGAPCTLPDGSAGTCVETMVSRPDYSNGPPPTYRQVKSLVCQATAGAGAKKQAFDWRPWLGVALTALALLAALATRGRRRVSA